MVFFIATEAMFFTFLLGSYWFLRFRHGPVWPPDGIKKPDLFLVSIMTPILLLSSGPMHWAELGIKRGRLWQLRLGLLARARLKARRTWPKRWGSTALSSTAATRSSTR